MNALLSGVFLIDAELYEELTGDGELGPSERGDLVLVTRFTDSEGDGLRNFLHLRRGMSPEDVADGLRCAAEAIEEWDDE